MAQKDLFHTHSVFPELGCKQVHSVKAKLQVRGMYSPSQLAGTSVHALKIPVSALIKRLISGLVFVTQV